VDEESPVHEVYNLDEDSGGCEVHSLSRWRALAVHTAKSSYNLFGFFWAIMHLTYHALKPS